MKRLALTLALPLCVFLLSSIGPDEAARAQDAEAITTAVTSYARAFYDVQPELIEQHVHPELAKFGFHRAGPGADYKGSTMSYEQAVKLAGHLNQQGALGAELTQTVTILDQLDMTAAVKLEALWGIDYVHLGKFEGEWKILQVIWQSHPE